MSTDTGPLVLNRGSERFTLKPEHVPLKWIPFATADFLNNTTAWASNSYQTGGYAKDPLGFVHLRGLLVLGAGFTIGYTAAAAVLRLPVGFRPVEQMLFPAIHGDTLGRVDIVVDGTYYIRTGAGAFPGTYASLNGISFHTGP